MHSETGVNGPIVSKKEILNRQIVRYCDTLSLPYSDHTALATGSRQKVDNQKSCKKRNSFRIFQKYTLEPGRYSSTGEPCMKNLSALIVASFLASSPAIQADDNRQRLQQNSDRTASQSTADYLQELIEAQARADTDTDDQGKA